MSKSVSTLDIVVGSGTCEGEFPGPGGGDCNEPLTLCDGCGSTHPPEDECKDKEHRVHLCHVCETPVDWVKNPESEKRKRKRKLRLAPTDDLGIKMLRRMGLAYFRSTKDLGRWNEYREIFPESQIKRTITECSKGRRFHGRLDYTLNKLGWLIDNGKVEKKPVVVEFDPDAPYVP